MSAVIKVILLCVVALAACSSVYTVPASGATSDGAPLPASSPSPPASSAASSNSSPAASASAPNAVPGASAASFFQLPQDKTTADARSSSLALPHAGYRFVWHVLDNLGVPMFFGLDNDLDPSLRRADVMPPSKFSTKSTEIQMRDKSGQALIQPPSPPSTQPSSEIPPEKIPKSELEGTQYEQPAIEDEKKQTP